LLDPIVSNLHIFVTKWIYYYPIDVMCYLFHVNFVLKYMQIFISIVYVSNNFDTVDKKSAAPGMRQTFIL